MESHFLLDGGILDCVVALLLPGLHVSSSHSLLFGTPCFMSSFALDFDICQKFAVGARGRPRAPVWIADPTKTHDLEHCRPQTETIMWIPNEASSRLDR